MSRSMRRDLLRQLDETLLTEHLDPCHSEFTDTVFNLKLTSISLNPVLSLKAAMTMHVTTRLGRAGFWLWCLPFLFLVPVLAQAGEQVREQKTCPFDPNKFTKLKKRANRNLAEAQTILASCYELGRNVAPSRAEAVRWLERAAEQSYAPAERELGRIYLYGR